MPLPLALAEGALLLLDDPEAAGAGCGVGVDEADPSVFFFMLNLSLSFCGSLPAASFFELVADLVDVDAEGGAFREEVEGPVGRTLILGPLDLAVVGTGRPPFDELALFFLLGGSSSSSSTSSSEALESEDVKCGPRASSEVVRLAGDDSSSSTSISARLTNRQDS